MVPWVRPTPESPAGHYINIRIPRIPANEREPVGAIHNLTGPTKLWVTQLAKVCSTPAQKACKSTFDLFRLTCFVILSTDQEQVPTIGGLRQPNIVERVGRLAPLEKVSFTLSLRALPTAIVPSRDQHQARLRLDKGELLFEKADRSHPYHYDVIELHQDGPGCALDCSC
jgi:hypothetical protein